MKNINIIYLFLFLGFISFTSCTTDDLDPSLEQNKSVEGSITDVSNLYGIIKGAYSTMTATGYYGRDYIATNEVRSENCFSNGNSGRFITQASFTYDKNTGFFWDEAYAAIASANIIIGTDVTTLTGDQEYGKHIQGQAYAIRALCHFDLLKQYGQQNAGGTLGVPYVTEFKGSDLFPARNTVAEVKQMIMDDLTTAFNLMSESYYDSSQEFFNKFAAKALESRVATYFGDWPTAKTASEAVITSGHYSIISASSYVGSFGQNSSANSIFELAFNLADNRGGDSLGYIYKTGATGSYGDLQVIDGTLSIFEAGDVRANILGYEPTSPKPTALRNLYKFPDINGVNNYNIIRFEEIILNYAEALFETGGDALTQINLLRAKRGVPALGTVTKNAILLERRKEFMFEGFRFDDLMRTGSAIPAFSLQQNITSSIPYGDFRLAWAIPAAEMNANSNMVQNKNY
jgi:hypothetical protein